MLLLALLALAVYVSCGLPVCACWAAGRRCGCALASRARPSAASSAGQITALL